MNAKNALAWQVAMGADEAIMETPTDWTKVLHAEPPPRVAEPRTPKQPAPAAQPGANFYGASVDDQGKRLSHRELQEQTKQLAERATTREELQAAITSFKGLAICKTATNTVFSDGNPQAEIMFIGEAPGENEDKQGIPFCGQSGQLMDKACAAIGLTREKNWYISNTVFWRPPGNRKPTREEIDICKPFVERHIALIKPKIIVLVGGTATSALMDTAKGITRLRGTYGEYKNPYLSETIPMTALFHPSYLLRSPGKKKDFWFDLLKLREVARQKGISL